MSRPLDRNRPLWEVYFVEGLADGRVAMLSKAHQALVDGAEVVDLAQVLLDRTPQRRELGGEEWHPGRPVSGSAMVLEALRDSVGTPYTALDTAVGATDAVLREVELAGRRVATVANALAGRRGEQATPISGPLSQQRRWSRRGARSRSTAACATPMAAPSTTSCSPPSPGPSAAG